MLASGSPILVRKLRPDRGEVFRWRGSVVRHDAEGVVLQAHFNVPEWEMGFVTILQGDLFTEFYFADRWYNVFQVNAPDGTLKGWYCNVGSPAEIDELTGELRYVDLALDVWAAPDGTYHVLDEDEYRGHLAAGHYPAPLDSGAERGRVALLALVAARALPRWPESARP